MSESQLPERCTKCDFNFPAFSGFNFCPKCGCRRVKPEQAVNPTSNGSASSTNGFTSESNGHENIVTADKSDTNHADQERNGHDSTTDSTKLECSVEDTIGSAEGVGSPLSVELANNGVGVVSIEKSSIQRSQEEPEQLTTNENNDTPKLGSDSKVISAHTSTHIHAAEQVEETRLPKDPISEGITNSSALSSDDQQSHHEDLPECPPNENAVQLQEGNQTSATVSPEGTEPETDLTNSSIIVTFHALVPLSAWSWNDRSVMTIRFGDPKLSGWNKDGGALLMKRKLDTGLAEFQCSLQLPVEFLVNEAVTYRYVICDGSTDSSVDTSDIPFEFLSHEEQPSCRCTMIEEIFSKGDYHQFDGVVMPEPKSWFGSKALKFIWRTQETPDKTFNHYQEKSLLYYLDDMKNILIKCGLTLNFGIHDIKKKICHVFSQLFHSKVQTLKLNPGEKAPVHIKVAKHLPEVFQDWLLSIAKALHKKTVGSAEDNAQRMASTITVILCLREIMPSPQLPWESLTVANYSLILSLLYPLPDLISQKSLDLEILIKLIHPEEVAVAEVLISFCKHLAFTKHLKNPEWLYAIPLIHFMLKQSVPFEKPNKNHDKILWDDPQLDLVRLRRKKTAKKTKIGVVKRHFKELKPLGALDPLFLPLFTLLCPEKELPELFLQIPLHLSAAFTLLLLRDATFSDSEVMYFSKLLQVLLVVIKQPSADMDLESLESTLNSSRNIYMQLIQKLSQATKRSSEVIRIAASLLFYTITTLKKYAPDEEIRSFVQEQSRDLVHSVHNEIVKWMQKVYGNTFGSPVVYNMLLCASEELEFCQSLYKLDCPQHIQESWQPAVLQTINKRIKRVPLNKRIDLFCVLETQKAVDQNITALFMEAVMESIHQMKLTDTAQGVEKLYRGTSKQRDTVGNIMENILVAQYPIETQSITFDQLLEWEMWPCFIKIYTSEPKGGKTTSCLTEHCAILSACAHNILTDMCERLSNGDIVVQDLQKIAQRRVQMEKLCSVISHWKGLKKQHPKDDLARRLHECENFMARRELLNFLCSQVTVPVIGLEELKDELRRDFSSCSINCLCAPSKGKGPVEYLCCVSAAPLEPIMVQFRVMAGENNNDIFQKIWLKMLNSIRNSYTELAIEGIVEHLWEPAFEECLRLLDEIRDLTILLSSVDVYFLQYNDERHIVTHLFSLYSGVEMCKNNRRPSNHPMWLKRAVHLMVQYWKLCQYTKAAKVVIDVSIKLKIAGDFRLMRTLATKGMSDMKSSPLSSIDEDLIGACYFLEDFRDEKKLDCLQTFVNCADIIEWIRTYTKEVNELHRFVSIALHTTAGEGDYESDKLATLRTVVTAFEPLIYGLKGDVTYQVFCAKCRSVWDELRKNPQLPQMLRTCNDELEWYKSLKDTQDSVTSYGEMNNILKHGVFRIESNSSSVVTKLHSIITLRLNTTDRKITKRHYSFVELQDLESKLVLITGSKTKNRHEVDLFLDMFHGIYRVADALIELQQSGNVSYLGWTMEVACGPDKVEALATQARLMEYELTNWIDKVKQTRKRCYELNYFTTPQLIILRRELGMLKSARANISISPMVLSLLQSISFDISLETITKAVKEVALLPPHSEPDSFPSLLSSDDSKIGDQITAEQKCTKAMRSSTMKKTKSSVQKIYTPIADKLNNEQREILMYIVDRFGFPQQLVLKAFEVCKGEVNKYDIQNWCMENAERYQFYEENSDDEPVEIVNEDHLTSQVQTAGISSGMMSWVGQSLKQYFAPPKRHAPAKPKGYHPPPPSRCDKVPGLTIIQYSKSEEMYLRLEQLGMILKNLPVSVLPPRPFKTPILKTGSPNLIVTSPGSVLKVVLSIYMEGESLPLPTLEEVLICSSSTTSEEVILLLLRSISDSPSYNRIFCLVHAERLSYQVSDKVLHSLAELSQGQTGYRLVIICGNENEEKSLVISRLHRCRRQFAEPKNDDQFKGYLKAHFTGKMKSRAVHALAASSVDQEKSCVRVVSSDRPGMGKSFYIKQMAQSIKKTVGRTASSYTIPIHGPEVTADTMMDFLINHLQDPYCSMYHLDIASNILWKVDTILFSLIILHGLTDSQGRIWRTRSTHYFTIETTLPKKVDFAKSPEAGIYSLLNLLPTVHCLGPDEILKSRSKSIKSSPPLNTAMNKKEFQSATYQRVYQYLCRHEKGNIDRFCYSGKVEGSETDCLSIILRNCGVRNPSWREIKHFVEFLSIQLQSCEESVYCNETLVGDVLAGLKSFVVKFMIRMSKDFATPSLEGELARQNLAVVPQLNQYQIDSRKLWEQTIHPYLFFNQSSDGTITFVGFKVTPQGNLVHPVSGNLLEANIMSSNLFTGLQQNGVNFSEDYTQWGKSAMIQKLCAVMGVKTLDPDTSYVLTMDNIVKILAIYMRFRCNIPVVIMGETGCGKTRLIRYMSELARQELDVRNMYIMKVHGGITESNVQEFVHFVNKAAKTNAQQGVHMTIAFFDEANTTDALGLIKEVMCDHRINGQPISEHIKFIAACNPYRKHSDEMIDRLKNAGLGFYVRESDTTHKLGNIPLRHLVYRVLDLPPSMRPLVYDFGQLKTDTEYQYIYQVVSNHVYRHGALRTIGHQAVAAIAKVLNCSQDYMKCTKNECSFVSLRDVERAMIVLVYFYDNMKELSPLIDIHKRKRGQDYDESTTILTRSLVLSLSVCYHARLRDRSKYEVEVSKQFTSPLSLPGGAKQFRNEIQWCQEVFLDNMRLGENIAKNAALRENTFMMAVCIELRIPLFIVGKPGSSKSLAKSIIQESMKGKASRNKLMRCFKEVDMFSYQCSQLSTSDSVIEVFKTAKKFQQKQDISKYVAVVVLDEVGLAEDSPNLPLKALHPLLEDGTAGGGDEEQRNFQDKVVSREERVAFIGISNWALDPAKMNRGVMVTRGDPTERELELSAKGICSNKENDPVRERLEEYFQPLAKSYMEICKKQRRQFFGLRDFYSLIKMMYWMCDKSGSPPTWSQLEHAIRRNFGGLDEAELNPLDEFKKNLPCIKEPLDLTQVPPELHPVVNPDCSRLGLIKTSLRSTERTWHGESRYLLFLTENYVALDILKHYLGTVNAIHQLDMAEGQPEEMEPYILFGSSFPKDKEYTQVCRNINQVRVCMETGRTVILLNLENLYESLYDVLNQYYIYNFGNRYVDLGLQTHRVRCRVHDNFKLILIAEKETVYSQFPTPLINRLEKHFVLMSSILEEWQMEVLNQLRNWIKAFSPIRNGKFSPGHAFIGFQTDTPAAVIFQSTNFLRKLREQGEANTAGWEIVQSAGALRGISPEELATLQEDSEQWKDAILMMSQYQLLQTASPDAIVRLQSTSLASESETIQKIYFGKQAHGSIDSFLKFHLKYDGESQAGGLLLQVTTHSHLLSHKELNQLENMMEMNVVSFHLHEFETELDFCNKIGPHFKQEPENPFNTLLIIQCNSSYTNSDLIACARYRVYDERAHNEKKGRIHVMFIISVPRQNTTITQNFSPSVATIGYLGDPWISAHVDDLSPSTDNTSVTPHAALGFSISELFMGKRIHASESETTPSSPEIQIVPLYRRLQDCIQASASKLHDVTWRRATKRIEILVGLIAKDSTTSLGVFTFHGILVQRIAEVMRERDNILDPRKHWVLEEAMNLKKLHTGGTFGNVLARKVDEVIVPIFAYIISVIDQNYNLDLVEPGSKLTLPVSQLWLAIFQHSKVLPFNYDTIAASKEKLPGAGSRTSEEDFKCQFPFSWIVKDTIDALWSNAKRTAGDDVTRFHTQLAESFCQTNVGAILDTFEPLELHKEAFGQYYLHDFVRMAHKCKHKKKDMEDLEYDLIANSLSVVASTDSHAANQSLSHYFASLHIAYHKNKAKIVWFSQLVSFNPGIMISLRSAVSQHRSEMVLHLLAVDKFLSELQPPLNKESLKQNLVPWLNDIRMCQNTVNSILSLSSQSQCVDELMLSWQLIQAMRMFLEHVMLHHTKVSVKYARRLETALKQCGPNFLNASTLQKVKEVLKQIDREQKSKSSQQHKYLLTSCQQFFMEVVSSLCFGGQKAPEPELIKCLMEMVFATKEGAMFSTRDITPYDHETQCDSVPVIRSFLLQLLLEHNSDVVKTHLQTYFTHCCQALRMPTIDLNLCLLCIQCFEDALSRSLTDTTSELNLKRITETMNEGYVAVLYETTAGPATNISVLLLEGLAKIRFSLSVVADIFETQVSSKQNVVTSSVVKQLVYTTQNICSDLNINVIDTTGSLDTTGPIVYLMRLLVRQYGMSCLEKIVSTYSWIIPKELRNKQEGEEKIFDPFVLYNDHGYSGLREILDGAAYGRQMDQLALHIKDMNIQSAAILLLGVYRKVTLSRVAASSTRQIVSDVLMKFDRHLSNLNAMNSEMKRIGRKLIANEQGRNLASLVVVPKQSKHIRNFAALVVHAAVVFSSKVGNPLLLPFMNMLQNPAALKNAYLPTMAEDSLYEVRQAGGQFYQCPRGHPYYVGECGRPMQEYTCNTCGSKIGGRNHTLRADNQLARINDATKKGHDLGKPAERISVPSPERDLSPLAVCIIRALMHSAFIWTCSNDENLLGDVASLVNPPVRPNLLPEFFWKHLEKDIEVICKLLKRGEDESILIVHLVLKEILTQQRYSSVLGNNSHLNDRPARRQWEVAFNDAYIRSVTETLDRNIHTAFQSVMNDNDQEHDQLFYLVYERMQVSEGSIIPHMWTFQSKITLESLTQKIQEKSIKDQHPILYEFLQAEPNLRATQYLPDIVHLQQYLYDTFNFCIDRNNAKSTTIGQFISTITNDAVKENFKEYMQGLSKAWQLVVHKLKTHGRLRVREEYLIPAITAKTPLEYIIPTTIEAGACTTALVDFLTLTHNDFIERCRSLVSSEEQSALQTVWSGHKVPITHINHCHLVIYEQQLQSILLSHCHYSLTAGSNHLVRYDLQALEKHILDRFIHGKPMILADIPQVIYRKDTYTAARFGAIREKVSPQERLPVRIQQDILTEVHTLEGVHEILDVIDIVLGFLSSGGGSADKPLGEYVEKVLKMNTRKFSPKIQQYCKLGHIVSLWKCLSVELARQLYFRGEEPFDSVKKDLAVDLSKGEKQELENCLRSFDDLNLLLEILFEFIQTHVQYCPANEFEWLIADVLPVILDQWGLPEYPEFEDNFPGSINLSQAIATWKCIVLYQRNLPV